MVANKNGTVSFKGQTTLTGSFMMDDEEGAKIPFKIQTAYKNFELKTDNLVSLCGMPDKVNGDLFLSSKKLKTLEHCTPIVGKSLYLDTPTLEEFNCKVQVKNILFLRELNMTGLSNLHKYFNCGTVTLGPNVAPKITHSMLSLILIPNLITVVQWGFQQVSSANNTPSKIEQVCSIIRTSIGKKDLLDVKEELMANGLKEYAKL
jgi:hypothetical protein